MMPNHMQEQQNLPLARGRGAGARARIRQPVPQKPCPRRAAHVSSRAMRNEPPAVSDVDRRRLNSQLGARTLAGGSSYKALGARVAALETETTVAGHDGRAPTRPRPIATG